MPNNGFQYFKDYAQEQKARALTDTTNSILSTINRSLFVAKLQSDKQYDKQRSVDDNIALHQQEYNNFVQSREKSLAALNQNLEKVAQYGKTNITMPFYIEDKKSYNLTDDEARKATKFLGQKVRALLNVPHTFDPIKQTPQEFMKKNVDLAVQYMRAYNGTPSVSLAVYEQHEALRKMFGAGEFIEYDLETFLQGDIFQYAFLDIKFPNSHALKQVKSPRDLLKRVSIQDPSRPGLAGLEQGLGMLHGMIGFTDAQANTYQKMFEEYANSRNTFNQKNLHVMQSLAKIGNKNTKITYHNEIPGLATLDAFVEQSDVSVPNLEDIKTGIDRLVELGKWQRANMVNYHGQNMTLPEAHMLAALYRAKKGNIPLGSQNGAVFDSPMINSAFLANASDGARKVFLHDFGSMMDLGNNQHALRQFDMRAAMLATTNPMALAGDTTELLAQINEYQFSSKGILSRAPSAHALFGNMDNASAFEQAINDVINSTFKNAAATMPQHTAPRDVAMQALTKILYYESLNPSKDNDKYIFKEFARAKNSAKMASLLPGDLFYFQGYDRNAHYLTLTHDTLNNSIRLVGLPYSFSAKGKGKVIDDEISTGLRKHGVYKLLDIGSFDGLDKADPSLFKQFPNLGSQDLIYVKWEALTGVTKNAPKRYRSQNHVYQILPRADLARYLSLFGTEMGHVDLKTNKYDDTTISDFTRQQLLNFTNTDKHKLTGIDFLEQVLEENNKRIEQESTTRRMRELKYSTMDRAIKFLDYVDGKVTQNTPIEKVLSDAISKNDQNLAKIVQYNWHRELHDNSAGIDALASGYEYFKGLKPIFQHVVDAVNATVPQNASSTVKNLYAHNYFRQFVYGLMNYANQIPGGKYAGLNYEQMLGYAKRTLSPYERDNTFTFQMLSRNPHSEVVNPTITVDLATPSSFVYKLRSIYANDSDIENAYEFAKELGNRYQIPRLQKIAKFRRAGGSVQAIENEIRAAIAGATKSGLIPSSDRAPITSIDISQAPLVAKLYQKLSPQTVKQIADAAFSMPITFREGNHVQRLDDIWAWTYRHMPQTDAELRKELSTYGYASDEIERIIKDVQSTRTTTRKYIKSLLDIFDDSGNVITSTAENRPLVAYTRGSSQEFDFTGFLPEMHIDKQTGHVYTKFGNQKINITKGMSVALDYGKDFRTAKEVSEHLVIDTPIRQFFDTIYLHTKGYHTSLRANPSYDRVKDLYHLMDVHREILGKFAFVGNDFEDATRMFSYDINGFYASLPEFYHQGGYNGVQLSDDILAIIQKLNNTERGARLGRLSQAELNVLRRNQHILLSPLQNALDSNSPVYDFFHDQVSRENAVWLATHANHLSKKAEQNWVSTTHMWDDYLAIGSDAANINSTFKRAFQLDFDKLDLALREKTYVGPSLLTKQQAEYVAKHGYEGTRFGQAFRGNLLNISTDAYHEILRAAGVKNETAYKYLEEGAGLINPRIAAMERKRFETFIVDGTQNADVILHKLALLQDSMLERSAQIKRETAAQIKWQNGVINFVYGDGVFVDRNDKLLSLVDFTQNFGGGVTPNRASRTGQLLRGWFTADGELVSESEITSLLRKNLKKGLASDEAQASQILTKAGFHERLYIRDLESTIYSKFTPGTEKGMMFSPIGGLGTTNNRVAQLLDDIGLAKLKGIQIDDYWVENQKRFTTLMQQMADPSVANKIDSAIQRYGFSRLKQDIMTERYAPWEEIMGAINGALGQPGKDIIAISHVSSEAGKDSHLRPPLSGVLSDLAEQGFGGDYQALADELNDVNKTRGRKFALDGSIDLIQLNKPDPANPKLPTSYGFVLNGTVFDEQVVKDIAAEKGFDLANSFNMQRANVGPNGTPISYSLNMTEFRLASDWKQESVALGGNKKGVKITRRLIENMERPIWNQIRVDQAVEHLTNIYGAQEAFKHAQRYYGDIMDVALDNGVLKGTLKDDAVNRMMNAEVINHFHTQMIAGGEGIYKTKLLSKGQLTKDARDILYNDAGLTNAEVDKIEAGFASLAQKNARFQEASVGYALGVYRLNSAEYAQRMTRELSELDPITAQSTVEHFSEKFGLEIFNIADINDAKILHEQANVHTDRGFIVDFGDNPALRPKFGRYFVMPAMPNKLMNGETPTENKLQVDLLGMIRTYAKAVGTPGKDFSKQIEDAGDNMMLHLTQLMHGKQGYEAMLSTYYAKNSILGKADIFRIIDDDALKLFTQYKVGNKTLNEFSSAGYNAVFIGKDFFEHNIDAKLLDKLGLDVESATKNVLDVAKTEGTLGLTFRWPPNYFGSIADTRIYLNETLGHNMIQLTEAAAEAMKADMDGDTINSLIVKSKARVFKDGQDMGVHEIDSMTATALATYKGANFRVEYLDHGNLMNEMARNAEIQPGTISRELGHKVNQRLFDAASVDYAKSFKSTEFIDGLVYLGANSSYDAKAQDILQSSAWQSAFESATKSASADATAVDIFRAASKDYLSGVSQAELSEQTHALASHFYNNVLHSEDTIKRANRAMTGKLDTIIFPFWQALDRLEQEGLWKPDAIQSANGKMYSADEFVHALNLHLIEGGTAAKNNASTETIADMVQPLQNAISSWLGLNGQRDTEPLYDIIRSLNTTKEMKRVVGSGATAAMGAEDIINALESINFNGQVFSKEIFEGFKRGYRDSGNINDKFLASPQDALRDIQMAREAISEGDISFKESSALVSGKFGPGATMAESEEAERIISQSAFSASSMADDLFNGMSNTAKALKNSISANKIGIGLGFAAALMGLSYIGGNPTTPADGQAQGIQAQNASYEIPNLMSQYSSPESFPHNNQSYLININADTEQGQEYVQQAMYSAFQQQPNMSSNINMTMNVKDSTHNLTPQGLLNYITNSF